MKTRTMTTTALAAVLISTLIVEAHPHRRDQDQRKQTARSGSRQLQGQRGQPQVRGRRNAQDVRGPQRQNPCQDCRQAQLFQERQGQRKQLAQQAPQRLERQRQNAPATAHSKLKPQRRADYRPGRPGTYPAQPARKGSRQQLHASQTPREINSQQNRPVSPERRQAMLKKFDTDQDGQLSKKEREAARKAIEGQRRGKPGNAAKRPAAPSGEE